MRAVIIGNGDIRDYEYIKSKISDEDFIICADGGFLHTRKMQIEPDIIIGDFDSAEDFEGVKNRLVYPRRKDFTDGELAVMYADEHGYDEIVLLGMTGDRMDHTIADIMLLNKCKKGVLIDDNNEIYLLKDKLRIDGRRGQTLSVIPVFGDAEGVAAKGLEYPLDGGTLYFSSARGISNVMLDSSCEITIEKGLALVIKVNKV